MRPRPGREKAAEYGSWLILICWIADVLTFRLLTSIPLTRMVTPPVPSDPLSRNRDTAATASSSKIGRLSSAPVAHRHGVGIGGGAGGDLRRAAGDRHLLVHAGQRQRDPQRLERPAADVHGFGPRLEAVERHQYLVAPRRHAFERERAGRARRRGLNRLAGRRS